MQCFILFSLSLERKVVEIDFRLHFDVNELTRVARNGNRWKLIRVSKNKKIPANQVNEKAKNGLAIPKK